MTSALTSQETILLPTSAVAAPSELSQGFVLQASGSDASPELSQALVLAAVGPPVSETVGDSQTFSLIAISSGDTNVTADVTQTACLIAYYTAPPTTPRQNSWTFILDGHRFYVVPLGPEGDWAFDTTTREWCQLQTQGFDGLNFTHGTMWGIRVIGGDSIDPYLYELDPNEPLDEQWREIKRIVTGGIATRSRSSIGVANFSLTASVGDDNSIDQPISLAFSDDNGVTWSDEFDIPLTDSGSQLLIWNALGSFSQPGRVFRITDTAGPVRLDGADCVLNYSSGADSGQDQDRQQ